MRNTGQWRVPEASSSELVHKEFGLHHLSSKPHPHICLTLPPLPQRQGQARAGGGQGSDMAGLPPMETRRPPPGLNQAVLG